MSKQAPRNVGPAGITGVTVSITSTNRVFGADGGTITLEADNLPWDSPLFCRGLLEMATLYAIAHKGVTSPEGFITSAIKQGTPSSKLLKQAEGFLASMEEAGTPWEAVEAGIKAKYPWTLQSRDLDGLIDHFARKAEFESKAKDPLSAL